MLLLTNKPAPVIVMMVLSSGAAFRGAMIRMRGNMVKVPTLVADTPFNTPFILMLRLVGTRVLTVLVLLELNERMPLTFTMNANIDPAVIAISLSLSVHVTVLAFIQFIFLHLNAKSIELLTSTLLLTTPYVIPINELALDPKFEPRRVIIVLASEP